MDINLINKYKNNYKVIKSELINCVSRKYLGIQTYKFLLNNGKSKICECITKSNMNGDAVVIIPLIDDDNCLMIVQSRPLTNNFSLLEFPAGMVDKEESFKDAALRELREETGYVASFLYELDWHYQDQGCSKSIVKTYVAMGCKKEYETNLDCEEYLESVKVSLNDFKNLISSSEDVKDANTKIAMMSYYLKNKYL